MPSPSSEDNGLQHAKGGRYAVHVWSKPKRQIRLTLSHV
jgi:hypothetical protein